MIKVVSGHTDIGGSTIALINLVNLFNQNGLDACLFGNSSFPIGKCTYTSIGVFNLEPDDILIYHFLPITERPNIKKVILTCHETNWFNIKKINPVYDNVHFVSQFQKEWQGVDGTVIPNLISKLKHKIRLVKDKPEIAGVIGSIDRNKRTHISIEKALEDGCNIIKLFGRITDNQYYLEKVAPLLEDNKVIYCGVMEDKQSMYNQLDIVYHSPELETFNMIKPECAAAGVAYVGNEGNDTKAEIWDDNRILEAWKNLLFT